MFLGANTEFAGRADVRLLQRGLVAAAEAIPAILRDAFQLGPVQIARARTLAAMQVLPERREKTLSVLFQLSGRSRFEQLGNLVEMGPGDATLCDDAAPFALETIDAGELLLLRAPARMLKEHLPSPEYFCARLLSHEQGLSAPVSAMALAILRDADPALSETHQLRMARHMLDLVATSYAIAFDTLAANSSVINGRQASAKLYIEQHLRDPDLTPCSIAIRLKLSSRYLRLIFAAGNETVSAYILRRRLEECAKQIADPRWRGHSMTEIAFAWGFNSAPHFTRSFRDRFGMSPRDYRRARLADDAELRAAA